MPGIASAATAVVIAHVAAGTSTIRLGAGGIMLPNHAPLIIAEQFGTLAALHPGRIDLGLGRAPGTDMLTARALRRNLDQAVDTSQDVVELMNLSLGRPGQRVRAVPGERQDVQMWVLGSSTYSAQLAAILGLPMPLHRISHRLREHAIDIYRSRFSRQRGCRPHLMPARHHGRRNRRRSRASVLVAAAGFRQSPHRSPRQAASPVEIMRPVWSRWQR